VYGVRTTDFFCGLIGKGSVTLLTFTANPLPVLGVLAAVLFVVVWLVRRASWGTARAFPVRMRRTFAETVVSAWLAYRKAPFVFLGIGLVIALMAALSGLARELVTQAPVLAQTAPTPHGWGAVVATGGLLLTSLTTLFSNAATVQTLADLDAGEPVGVLRAYRKALRRGFALLGSGVVYLLVLGILILSVFLLPLAVVAVLLTSLTFPITMLERHWGLGSLWRSVQLVRHQWFKTAMVIVLATALFVFLGGLLGSGVILAFQVPFILANLIPGIVVGLLGPVLTLMLGYLYYHGLALEEDAATPDPGPEVEDSETALV
jgi:hypothetical protein